MSSLQITRLVDGKPGQSIDVRDRGLAYGHGLFETMRVAQGRVPLWTLHYRRLRHGCEKLDINLPDNIENRLKQDLGELFKDQASGIFKVILTAGSGGRGYRSDGSSQARRFAMRFPLTEYPENYWQQGITLRTCTHRLSMNPVLAGVKHLNRLEQILARAEWQADSPQEGIMLDMKGMVVEGISTNIFGVREDTLITPSLENAGVSGVMREFLIELARKNHMAVEETRKKSSYYKSLPELFVCNSIIGIWPVLQWDDTQFQPGLTTARLQAKVTELFDR